MTYLQILNPMEILLSALVMILVFSLMLVLNGEIKHRSNYPAIIFIVLLAIAVEDVSFVS